MSMITGTVSVNAAFLQEIKEDNQQLRTLLDSALDLVSSRRRARVATDQLTGTLGQLRDQLAMHFALEEAFGYFEDAIEVAPRLSEWADDLRAEHGTLFLNLCSLVERVERICYGRTAVRLPRRVALEFEMFYDVLKEHEDNENALILEALDEDIGVGD